MNKAGFPTVNPSTGEEIGWSGKFTPDGVSAAEASRLFRRIFEDGLKALAIKFT